MVKKIVAIIQARMGSTRLPGKVLRDLCGKSVLGQIIYRLKRVSNISIVVATSDQALDDEIELECNRYKVDCFRGSEKDVLSRFYYAAQKYHADILVRICGDSPLLDSMLIEEEINLFLRNNNCIITYDENIPLGLGGEVFSFLQLEDAFLHGKEEYHREHVTPFIYENYNNIYQTVEEDYSKYRFTLDTVEDWSLIELIYKRISEKTRDSYFGFREILDLMREDPDIYKINAHVKQREVKLSNKA